MVRISSQPLKYDYHLCEDMPDLRFSLEPFRLKDYPVSCSKARSGIICKISSYIFSLMSYIVSPLNKTFTWMKNQASILGLWLIHPRTVSLKRIKETYNFVRFLTQNIPEISINQAILELLDHEAQFLYSSKLLAKTLGKPESSLHRMMKCQLLATISIQSLLKAAREELRLTENGALICQINTNPVETLERIDNLTLSLMKKEGLNPQDYIQTLLFLEKTERTLHCRNSKVFLAEIFPRVEKSLNLEHLSKRINRIKQNHPNLFSTELLSTTWYNKETLLSEDESLSQPTFIQPVTTYSPARELGYFYYKKVSHLIECLKLDRFYKICNQILSIWHLRAQSLPNFFLEIDRSIRQKQLFESYIISASAHVDELVDQKWMDQALIHFESWQSLSYQIESRFREDLSKEDESLSYEDILYAFIVHDFCRYKYKEGLKKAYQLLKRNIPEDQIEQCWLKDTLKGQLHFSDEHTLHMLERLHKKPLALSEILTTILYRQLPREKESLHIHFDDRAVEQRIKAIQTIAIHSVKSSYARVEFPDLNASLFEEAALRSPFDTSHSFL